MSSTLTTYLTLCAAIWGGFHITQSLLSADAKTAVARAVKELELSDGPRAIVGALLRAFDGAFKVRLRWNTHLPGFFRSCAWTLLIIGLVSAHLIVTYRGAVDSVIDKGQSRDLVEAMFQFDMIGLGFWLVGGLPVAFVVDFLSLAKSRWTIEALSLAKSPLTTIAWVTFDLVAAAFLAALSILATWHMADLLLDQVIPNQVSFGRMTPQWAATTVWYWLSGKQVVWPHSMYLYATFFPTLWVWTFAAGIALLRVAQKAHPIKSLVSATFDVEREPLSAIAWVLIVGMSFLYWPLVLLV